MTSVLVLWRLARPFLPYIAAVLALIGIVAWIDHRGYQRGYAASNAKVIAAANALTAKAGRVGRIINLQAAQVAAGQQHQADETRIIRNETTRIIERPVYRSICVDADGVGLLDRAVAGANYSPAGLSDGAAAQPAAVSAQR